MPMSLQPKVIFLPIFFNPKFHFNAWVSLTGVFKHFYDRKQLFISLLAYTCRAAALASILRPLCLSPPDSFLTQIQCNHLTAPCHTGSHLAARSPPDY